VPEQVPRYVGRFDAATGGHQESERSRTSTSADERPRPRRRNAEAVHTPPASPPARVWRTQLPQARPRPTESGQPGSAIRRPLGPCREGTAE
jgi:hypothetical protein